VVWRLKRKRGEHEFGMRVYVLLKPQMQLSVRSPETTNGAELHGGFLLKILKLKFVDFKKYLGIELYSLGCPMIEFFSNFRVLKICIVHHNLGPYICLFFSQAKL
jgi:hypothetical protein